MTNKKVLYKGVYYTLAVLFTIISERFYFDLMNEASTLSFIVGLLGAVITALVFIILVRREFVNWSVSE